MQSVPQLKPRRTQRMVHSARLLKPNRPPRVLRAPRTRLCKRRRRLRPAATRRTRDWIACSSSLRRSNTTNKNAARQGRILLKPPLAGGFFLTARDGRHATNAGAICGGGQGWPTCSKCRSNLLRVRSSGGGSALPRRSLRRAAPRCRRRRWLRECRCRPARRAPQRSNRARRAVLRWPRCRRA